METPSATPDTLRGVRPSAGGFTLVELMMTILVGSILMAIAVPMFRDTIGRSRLTEQANDLVAAMTVARSQAITANQQVSFCRTDSAATTACSASAGDWEFWLVINAANTILRRGDVPTHGGSMVVSSTLTDDRITYFSDGLARTNNVLVANQQVIVCSNHSATENRREITLGAGNRMSTARASGGC